jgi:hypothetical protein
MRLVLSFLVTFAAMSTGATAQEAPSSGILHNTAEAHSLTYRCSGLHGGRIECEFIKVAVRHKALAKDLPVELEAARKAFPSQKPLDGQYCSASRDALDVLEGRRKAPDKVPFERLKEGLHNAMRSAV